MSATGDGSFPRRAPLRTRSLRPGGFTLLELIVALAVAGLAAGASIAAYPKMRASMEYRSALRGVLAGMNKARVEAVRGGRATVFYIDPETRAYGVDGKTLGHFPDSVDVQFTVAGQEVDSRGRGHIRFHPEGGATGGSVDLLRGPGSGVRLRVDWLFGSVEQKEVSG
ncbi:MAG: prepilin-type N-terminal cleavage/methylation domain-containing protein [Azoarcus sp.]|jgi:general secretion pathway protein H|nr:prepilin-type N-terminal cleavage/methylation domain-containing protein [Azoarcus sp.]